ncbi:MAG: lipase, partial [Pseudomonadota bacterium]
LVCLQKVIVADQGYTQLFKASLQWLGVDNPNQFKLLSAEFDNAASETDSPTFSAADGLLILPKVDIPKQFGTERYTVSLAWVPGADDSTISLFELAKIATYINPDYVPNVTWKPYGMLHPEERRAVDILGRSIPYAQLADAIYDFDNITVDTWELIESISKSSGMQAGVYNNRDTGKLTLAFRGTEACSFPCSLSETKAYLLDVAADTALTLGFVNDQFKHAFNFAQDVVNRYPGRKITVTGHSLGGGLAQAVGAVLGLETFAFNSSPVPDDFFDSYTLSLTSEQLEEIIYVIADIHDPVSNTDETVKFYLNADHVTSLIQFDFDLKEIAPDQSFDFDDLRFDRHSITQLFNNATSLISTFREGW